MEYMVVRRVVVNEKGRFENRSEWLQMLKILATVEKGRDYRIEKNKGRMGEKNMKKFLLSREGERACSFEKKKGRYHWIPALLFYL